MSTPAAPQVFDRSLVRKKRNHAAKCIHHHNFLHEKTAQELTERLAPVSMKLPQILVWGGHTPKLCQNLAKRPGTDTIIWSDISEKLLQEHAPTLPSNCLPVVADEEYAPFVQQNADAIVSNLTLHSVNDVKGTLIQARQILKPNRPFVAALFGGETLSDIKRWLMQTEVERTGGAAPHIFPFADIRSFGDIMQGLGFQRPVIDSETIEVEYGSLEVALNDIRGMGEGNVLQQRSKTPISRQVFDKGLDVFAQKSVPVKIEIIYVIAWTGK